MKRNWEGQTRHRPTCQGSVTAPVPATPPGTHSIPETEGRSFSPRLEVEATVRRGRSVSGGAGAPGQGTRWPGTSVHKVPGSPWNLRERIRSPKEGAELNKPRGSSWS